MHKFASWLYYIELNASNSINTAPTSDILVLQITENLEL
jgi:hypothetical protein